MRIIVEGCGQWAMEYFKALKALVGPQDGVLFTYDSSFGLDAYAEQLPSRLFSNYLQVTLQNVEAIEKAGFGCWDTKDTLFKLQRQENNRRKMLPHNVDVVFVVTPDRTHCDVAEYWLGRASRVFVEKPFDVAASRIKQFCQKLRAQSYTEVFAVDHYFVRCNQAAADQNYFLDRLLTTNDVGKLEGYLDWFEFSMTEHPPKDKEGKYDAQPARKRALSLQGGMVFDMGSHALPVLLPFIDIAKGIRVIDVWAGVSQPLRDVFFSGAETFSIASVECYTCETDNKPRSQKIRGRVIIGKDVGKRPEKTLVMRGPGGKVRFDLGSFHVYHELANGTVRPVAPLHQDWTRFFVNEVLEQRVPRAVERFKPEGALSVVELLEDWRAACRRSQRDITSGSRPLNFYAPGAALSDLENDRYQVMRGSTSL